jgi:hypothetical protein
MVCKKKVTVEDVWNLKVGEGIVVEDDIFQNIWPKEKPKKKPRIGMFEV